MPDFAWMSAIIWQIVKNPHNNWKNYLQQDEIQTTITLEPLTLTLQVRAQNKGNNIGSVDKSFTFV